MTILGFTAFVYFTRIIKCFHSPINSGNRSEWSPIRSVIMPVISKIERPRSGSPICLITSMICTEIRTVDSQSDLRIL